MRSGVAEISIDWLSLTLPYEMPEDPYGESHLTPVHRILELLGVSKRLTPIMPRYSYDTGYENTQGVKVYVANPYRPYPTFMIDLSGSVCREVSHRLELKETSLIRQIAAICDYFSELRITRIDIAREFYDEEAKKVAPRALKRYFEQKRVVARSRAWDYHESHLSNKERDTFTGDTIYIGRAESDVFMRVYDKQKERIYSHGDLWLDKDKEHIRWEVVLRREFATDFVRRFFSYEMTYKDLLVAFNALITSRFRVEPTSEERQRKRKVYKSIDIVDRDTGKTFSCEVMNWYAKLFGTTAVRVFSPVKKNNKMVKQANWLEESIAPALFKSLQLHEARGGDPVRYLYHLLKQGKAKFEGKHKETLESYITELVEMNDDYIVSNHELENTTSIAELFKK